MGEELTRKWSLSNPLEEKKRWVVGGGPILEL